jgi:hypothetical protein
MQDLKKVFARWLSLRERVTRYCAALVSHLRRHLDQHAEKQKTGWGSSLEYKRRYTNPDDAKRHRSRSDIEGPR